MKKLVLSFLLAAGFYSTLSAQKTVTEPNAEKRNVSSFHGVEVSTGIKLVLTAGITEEVVVSAATVEYRNKIITKVENGILKIYYDNELMKNFPKEKRELKAFVSYKNIDHLDANTGAEIQSENTIKSSSLKIRANTGGIITGDLDVNELDVDQNTGSVVTLSGKAGKLDVNGNTGSIFKGADLQTNNCNATASTGAGVYISVQKELNVKANTGGFVKYKGDAGIRELKTNTGGSVTKI